MIVRNSATANPTNNYDKPIGTLFGELRSGSGIILLGNPWANFEY